MALQYMSSSRSYKIKFDGEERLVGVGWGVKILYEQDTCFLVEVVYNE